ncbi:Carboxypeptidase regulatory-like domain-containing protein [Granulicella pectinivorans]|uniref:Carboxypeptidase regulatory-like domain-containing protein n=1 Tax=Granulicella pectinivorans TaxID=474950 RepID=A0A1I6LDD4_9BACT|nr:TonB-dependent receptor [Granulicella pectinivorans]SFS01250.1 Carboxypeptidase regulatory-like domain-containing protein [Granulicella pectinivorans]
MHTCKSSNEIQPQAISRSSLLLFTLVFAFALTPIALCQVLYGTLVGNLTDSSGGAVVGASVEATSTATNIVTKIASDQEGHYLFTNLAPGNYSIAVTAPGFKGVTSQGVIIQPNSQRRVDVRLEVSSVTETVTVISAPAVLQSDQASVATQLEAAQLETLPGGPGPGMRNVQSLYTIVPGFSPPVLGHSESGTPSDTLVSNVNGVSDTNNNTRIDGASSIYAWVPDVAAYIPSTEAIQSVDIVTNSFDAEQGLAAGAIVNIATKSGTNQYHGTAWEYNTISALAARNYFLPVTQLHVPKYILNQFGVNFGGPIMRNKAFFFANWERSRRSQNQSGFQTVPTLAMRAGNFQGTGTTIYDPSTGNPDGTGRQPFANNIIPASRFAFAANQMLSLLPAPNVTTSALSSNFFTSASGQYTRDIVDSRVDYKPSSKSSTFLRYGVQKSSLFDPQPLGKAGGTPADGGQPGNAPSIFQAVGLGGTYAFTSNVFADANMGFSRVGLATANTDLDQNYGLTFLQIPGTNGPSPLQAGFPAFIFSGLSSLGNPSAPNPQLYHDNTYTVAANLTWTKRTHSLRFGMEYQHYNVNHFQPQNTYGPRGGFTFTGGLTSLKGGAATNSYNSFADFLLGLPQAMGKDTQFLNPGTLRESVWAFYARDQWQMTNSLTLTYGIRYEVYPFATRDHFGGNAYDPLTGNVYLGGLGGVSKTAGINAGKGNFAPRIGLAYRLGEKTVIRGGYGMTVNPDSFRNMLVAYPAVISQTYSGASSYLAAGSLATGIPAATFPDISTGVLPIPLTLTTTTYPHNYRRGYIESYNIAIQRDLFKGFTLQTTYVGTLSIREVVALNLNAAAPGTGTAGGALYKSLGTTAAITQETPMGTASYNGLQTMLKKRFAHGNTIGMNYTYSRSLNNYADNSDATPLVSYMPAYSKNFGLSGFDRKHNLQLYSNTALPFGKNQRYLTHGVLSYIAGGWQLNNLISRTSGTPFTVSASASSLNAPGNSQFANQVLPTVRILGGHGVGNPYFDTNAFAPVTTAAFGNASKNSLRGPGYFNWNLGLSKGFSFRDRYNFQIRGEAFNLTNTPTFGNPGANVSNVTTTNGVQNLNGFGIITSASNQRTMRLSARFNF